MPELKKWDGAVMIPVGLLEAAAWNPNSMSDRQFARLMDEIEESGFDEPLQVVKLPNGDKYRIIGGHHRFKAARALGHTEVPCVVKNYVDERTQKEKTVSRNVLRGEPDHQKMSLLINEFVEVHKMSEEEVADRFGYSSTEDLERYYQEARKVREVAAESMSDRVAQQAEAEGSWFSQQPNPAPAQSVPAPEPPSKSKAKPKSRAQADGSPKIHSYTLVFEDEDQFQRWVETVPALMKLFPDEKLGATLLSIIENTVEGK